MDAQAGVNGLHRRPRSRGAGGRHAPGARSGGATTGWVVLEERVRVCYNRQALLCARWLRSKRPDRPKCGSICQQPFCL